MSKLNKILDEIRIQNIKYDKIRIELERYMRKYLEQMTFNTQNPLILDWFQLVFQSIIKMKNYLFLKNITL